jgi:hypothetical protein
MDLTGVARPRATAWLRALLPAALIGLLVLGLLTLNPLRRPPSVRPVEQLAFERTVLTPGLITLSVRNDGPGPMQIAQVQVNGAFWRFNTSDDDLGRLQSAVVEIPYPWEEGLPLEIAIVAATGVTAVHEVAVAVETPRGSAGQLALLGLLIGVVPVGLGLLWLPLLRRAGQRWQAFTLALTVGVLGFLLVETIAEGLDLASAAGAALNGLGLFALGAVAAAAVLGSLGSAASEGSRLALLVAAGIGLHNLGEGLAVGAALAAGEAALGSALAVGFALHNATEGLAIAGPLGRARVSPVRLAALVGVAGAPAIPGAVLGGLAVAPAWAALAFGLAAGAIGQVLVQVGGPLARSRALVRGAGAVGLLAGAVLMYVTGLVAGPT